MLTSKERRAEAQTPLNQRIELWSSRASTTKDALGGDIDVEGLISPLHANITRVRGTEVQENGRVVPYAYYKILIHYRKDIDEAMFIKYQGRELDINSIIDLQERHLYIELRCTERLLPRG